MSGKETQRSYSDIFPNRPLEALQTGMFTDFSPELFKYVVSGLRGLPSAAKEKSVGAAITGLGRESQMLNIPPGQRKEIERILMESLTKPDTDVLKYALGPLGIGFRSGPESTETIKYPGAVDYWGSVIGAI